MTREQKVDVYGRIQCEIRRKYNLSHSDYNALYKITKNMYQDHMLLFDIMRCDRSLIR